MVWVQSLAQELPYAGIAKKEKQSKAKQSNAKQSKAKQSKEKEKKRKCYFGGINWNQPMHKMLIFRILELIEKKPHWNISVLAICLHYYCI